MLLPCMKCLMMRIAFNQDLSNWNVGNVNQCNRFSRGADVWSLDRPNFTNCNPN